MEHFFESSDTIGKGLGFSHFSTLLIGWLIALVLVCLGGSLLYRRLSPRGRCVMRRVLAALLVADELFKIIGLASHGNYTVDYLPLHLCSVNIFLIVAHSIKPTKTLDNFLYAIGLPAALAALLFPTWTKLPLLNFMHIHSFTVHILLAAYPLILTVCGEIRPNLRYLPKSLALLAGFALVALAVNLATMNGANPTNFMFLMSASKGNPLYYFEQAFGNHLYGYPVLIVAVLVVMYGPWLAYDALKRKKKATP